MTIKHFCIIIFVKQNNIIKGVISVAIRFLNSVTSTSSSFRVSCGELVVDDLWSVHHEVEMGVVRSGSITIETAIGVEQLNKGDIFFIAPNQKHRFDNNNNVYIEIMLLNLNDGANLTQQFIPNAIIKSIVGGNCTKFFSFKPGEDYYNNVSECFESAFRAEVDKPRGFYLLATGKFYELYYYLFASEKLEIYDIETQGKKDRALRRVTEYINENFCNLLTLDIIAEHTNLSRYYISHLFKELLNTTFINYLNELRLSRAALLLTTTDTPVIEIAGKSGFNNISNFNRAFKMYYGITPSKYRKSERSKAKV